MPIHRIAAALILLVPAVLSGACVADMTEEEDVPATTAEPIVKGSKCELACMLAFDDSCDWPDWKDDCARAPEGTVECGPKVLSCNAAEHAAEGTAVGIEWCYRECEHLH